MGKWVISKPYPKYLGNIQTLPNYLLPIKNWVLPRIIGSGRVGYPLPNGYGHPYVRLLRWVREKGERANKPQRINGSVGSMGLVCTLQKLGSEEFNELEICERLDGLSGLVCRNQEVRNLMSWKFVYNPRPDLRPGKSIQLQTRFFGSGQVLGNQTRFISGRVSGHSKIQIFKK